MNDNLSIFITVIVLVILLVIFPLYNHFERQDNMSYNLVLKSTTNFIDSVINCGYIDQQMYSNYVGEIANTGNLYDIELEAHKKIITADTQGIGEFQDQYLVDYNEDIFDERGTTNNNKNYDNLNEKSIKNGVYKLDVGDEIYIKVKNSGTTMAEALFRNIVTTATSKNITVNYGGIIKNNAWLKADNSAIAKELVVLTYKKNGAEFAKESKYLYHGEKNVEFTVAEKPNVDDDETFEGWKDENSGTVYNQDDTIYLTKSTTLIAQIKTSNPIVRLVTEYGAHNPPQFKIQVGIKYYESVLKDIEKDGYKFLGWFTEKEEGTGVKITADTVVSNNEDHELYAHWELIEYNITYNLEGGTNHSNNPPTYNVENSVTLESPTRNGYVFNGWYTGPNGTGSKKTMITGTGDVTLYANWSANKNNIIYKLDGGTNHSNNPPTYKTGTSVTLEDPTKTGYTFKGWYTSQTGGAVVTVINGVGEKTVYARWKPIEVTITLDVNGGTASETSIKRNYGEKYGDLPTPTKEKYDFNGWFKGNTKINDTSTVKVTGTEITLKAHWNIKSGYGLTKSKGNYVIYNVRNGTISNTYNEVEKNKIYQIDIKRIVADNGKKYYPIKDSGEYIPEEAFEEINVN